MIDDLNIAIQKVPGVSCLFFADDVVIWETGSHVQSMEYALNKSLMNLATWADMNKLEVSAEKTVSQLFTLSTKQHPFNLEYNLEYRTPSNSPYLNTLGSTLTVSSPGVLTSHT
ncbi:hypothetical protein JTE90_013135 [Oedothorax gibbosus]|uniref:Reverse transcriptase domain-containing protein n=1 Tax=Oedothorax gibbosus TaxID=931172 RepID=A0AAV6VLT4_9ARAC|nr:hypothetical protein JTE90_013135 [Oedothorax gibbosus]